MNPTPEFPATPSHTPTLTPSTSVKEQSPGSLSAYLYEQAKKSLNTVGMIPPAPNSSPCVSGEAQDNNRELAGSPYSLSEKS
jgi:hypothetical protein